MKLSDYGASISLKPYLRRFERYEHRDYQLDIISACRNTNYNFLAGPIYIHNMVAAKLYIEKCSHTIIVNIIPDVQYLGCSFVENSEKRVVKNILYPDRNIGLQKVVNRLRLINKHSGPFKVRIKFNNIVAQWRKNETL